jgi:phage tail tape-measure protein
MKKIKNIEEVFEEKVTEALTDYYSKFLSAKKKGSLNLLSEKFSQRLQQLLTDYKINKEKYGK